VKRKLSKTRKNPTGTQPDEPLAACGAEPDESLKGESPPVGLSWRVYTVLS